MSNSKISCTKSDDETPPPHIMYQIGAGNNDLTVLPEVIESNQTLTFLICNVVVYSISEIILDNSIVSNKYLPFRHQLYLQISLYLSSLLDEDQFSSSLLNCFSTVVLS